jgi:hypothetical protein
MVFRYWSHGSRRHIPLGRWGIVFRRFEKNKATPSILQLLISQLANLHFLQGEATLQEIQAALHDIAHAQLEMQKIESLSA